MTDFVEYLTAKRTVDDRALDRRTWRRFVDTLTDAAGAPSPADDGLGGSPDRPVRIVEVGAGVGSMLARLAAWETLPATVSYRGVDLESEAIAAAHDRVPGWLSDAGYAVDVDEDGRIVATDPDGPTRIEATFEVADAATVDDEADAVVAAAVLDVVDLDRMLPALRGCLRDGGVLYAPCTFDGGTGVSPAHPDDDRIERLYHRHMDEVRDLPGSSRAGRDLLERLPAHGYAAESVGGCDWVVRPHDGSYPHAEGAFLDHLLSTIDGALADYSADVLDPDRRESWIAARRDQRARGELTLVAHHLDVLARVVPDDGD